MSKIIPKKRVPQVQEAIDKARAHIELAMKRDNPMSHHVVVLALEQLANQYGYEVADQLIEEYELDEEYGIERQS